MVLINNMNTLIKLSLCTIMILYISYEPSTGASYMMSLSVIGWFLLFSIVFLVSNVIKGIYYRIKGKPFYFSSLIPSLYVLIISAIGGNHLNDLNQSAIEYLWSEAEKIQLQCVSEGQCPISPDGWVKRNNAYKYDYVYNNTVFMMSYSATKNDFNMYIYYVLDDRYYLNGGVEHLVSRGRRVISFPVTDGCS
ncbi:hypothetical protein ABT56_12410 [Photobacterium aquae]|uniref:Uncharacterized protein n=1 Tax=Photobacterium aquae TaxID=1195763 RepID=A0A0J1H031_9GAMM|nr:hypothetical protein [Photobacterium aquae]KLV05180.1 hypothetical protein ABT56_12410 [Photobacterium aquae]